MRKAGLLCVLLAVSVAGGCQALQKPDWALPDGVKTVEANGYPMAYVERGAGPIVVLVHGATLDYRYWTPQLESLSSRFRVIAVSLRHYYPEPWKGRGDFSLKLHGEDVAAFIERLGEPVNLVGHSRGGAVALAVAHARPQLVKKLVLMDPGLFRLLPSQSAAAADGIRIRRAKGAEEYFKRGDVEGGLRYFFEDINGPGTWSKLPVPQQAIRRDNAWTIVGQLGDSEFLTCTDVGRLEMPVLVMGGERSPKAFKNIGEALRRCLLSASAVTIPKAGHQMNQHNPGAFDAALADYLSRK